MNFPQTLQQIPQPEQRTKEWYEQRGKLITSSNIGTILDLNPYKKPKAYLRELLNPESVKFTGNFATEHGNYYEDPSINTYMSAFGYNGCNLGLIRACDNLTHRKRNTTESLHWLAGSVDKLVWPEEIEIPTQQDCIAVENKCPYHQPKLNYGSVKSYYWPQLQFNMYILDTDRGDYIEMIPKGFKGNDFHMNIVRIYRDDAWIEGYAIPKLFSFYSEWQSLKQNK
jgi:putative phage-type endonuclease